MYLPELLKHHPKAQMDHAHLAEPLHGEVVENLAWGEFDQI
jgi:hypothetical protein